MDRKVSSSYAEPHARAVYERSKYAVAGFGVHAWVKYFWDCSASLPVRARGNTTGLPHQANCHDRNVQGIEHDLSLEIENGIQDTCELGHLRIQVLVEKHLSDLFNLMYPSQWGLECRQCVQCHHSDGKTERHRASITQGIGYVECF